MPRTYRDYFYRLLKKLGLPKTRFHALRHSFATRCIESKCDYKTVSAILGHSSIATTLNLYVHPGLSQKRKCIERLAKFLRI
ncbi:MAG: tyrosine-type recombinase/integrase [Bacteroidales bacterium]|nr:tyrosine-type recombinase/integrase [Bacteroidales bacterium]